MTESTLSVERAEEWIYQELGDEASRQINISRRRWINSRSSHDLQEMAQLLHDYSVTVPPQPLSEPTEEDVEACCAAWDKPGDMPYVVRQMLTTFVRRYNASLQPKPDPRREAIREALVIHARNTCNELQTMDQFDAATDAVAKALDQLKEQP